MVACLLDALCPDGAGHTDMVLVTPTVSAHRCDMAERVQVPTTAERHSLHRRVEALAIAAIRVCQALCGQVCMPPV